MAGEGCGAMQPLARLSRVVKALGVSRSVWYAKQADGLAKPGGKPKVVSEALIEPLWALASDYRWWDYKPVAVIAGRQGLAVSSKRGDRVFKAAGTLQTPQMRQRSIPLRTAARRPE